LFKNGRWIRGDYIALVFLPSSKSQIIFAAARSFKNAVQRNMAKRYLRELYRRSVLKQVKLQLGLLLLRFPEKNVFATLYEDFCLIIQNLKIKQENLD